MNNKRKMFSVILSIFLSLSMIFVFSCKEPEVPTNNPTGDNTQEEVTPTIVDAVVPTIKSQPQNVTVSSGQSFKLSVVASVSDGGSLSYQWYQADDDKSVGTKIDNATSSEFTSSYDLDNVSVKSLFYYVVVVNTNNKVNGKKTSSVTSSYAKVTVNDKVNAVVPVINTQPSSFTGEKPDSLTLSIVATSSDGGSLTYQWYKANNLTSEGTKISGATSSTYQIPDSDLDGTKYYYCVVTNTISDNGDYGVKVQSVKSNYATVTIQPKAPDPIVVSEKSGVMLQGFNWESASRNSTSKQNKWYGIMQKQASEIKGRFAYVWMPPPSMSASFGPEGYLPTQLNNLNSLYGTATELKNFISSIGPTKAIADVVVNHRCGSANWGTFTNPAWDVDYKSIVSDDEGFNDSESDMYGASNKGAKDTGEKYDAARDLDHTNTKVQQGIINWMNNVLKPAGFVGWRYDYVKGFAGKYVGQYNEGSNAEFSVGEYWPTAGYNSGSPNSWGDEIKSWISATANGGQRSKAFDFALKGAMNTVFGNNANNVGNSNYSLLAHKSNLMISQPEDAVTFIDNHDTGSTQKHWYLDPADIGTGYALILTHPGYPCVAWQHYFTDAQSGGYGDSQYIGGNTVPGTSKTYRQHIDYLIDLRNDVGIEYDDKVSTTGTSSSCYVGEIIGNNGSLLVMIGNVTTPTREEYKGKQPIYSGTNFAIYRGNATELPEDDNSGDENVATGDVTLTLTGPSWTWDQQPAIFCWAWKDGVNGSWYSCTGSGTTVYATVPSDAQYFLIVRCSFVTSVPNWDVKDDSEGRIYNKTNDIKIVNGQTSYNINFVDYKPN